ncbi:MAG: hypothetical protein UV52_C0018G0003 [Parcubacteria group bacterium GW2011_GWD1_42_9]|nr:MAG: hypothetical protein UV52_C0018G0003 [Parcubacteria group bacterium GW2011_GWD1_42_9]KKT22552.1 MAG: hypothetical protein UW06_C0008G0013 [Parcubacteria group bacterium GW2011_GWE1_43_8]HCM45300.1 hypothetical protein [Candidatus Veblenbacteria bacterium]
MENIKYFLPDNREVSEEELWAIMDEFHKKNPNLPFEHIEQREGGKLIKVQTFSSPETCLKWEVEQYLIAKINKYREEDRCLVCGELNCYYKNQRIHR